jgi:uncharacterized protein
MKIGITGGSGFIGGYLSRALAFRGDSVIIFSRKPSLPPSLKNQKGISLVSAQLPSKNDLENLDVLINLSGEPVMGGRWSETRKDLLSRSRIEYTRELLNNLKLTSKPPATFIAGSAIGFYGMHTDATLSFDESSSPGDDFLSKLCIEWEKESLVAEGLGIRTCLLRTGIVLSPESGALAQMLPPFRAFVGGPIGSGKQVMSWIHIEDMVNSILFLIDNAVTKGVFNITSPEPVTNEDFSQKLAKTINRPCFMKVPSFAIEALYGEGANVVLLGQKVYPKRLEEEGFKFKYKDLGECLRNLLP